MKRLKISLTVLALAFSMFGLKIFAQEPADSTNRLDRDRYEPYSPQSTRYFWGPNGFKLKPKTGYYQNVWLVLNQFSWGIDERLSLGAGLLPPLSLSGTHVTFWIAPKVSFPLTESNDKMHLGVGVLMAHKINSMADIYSIIYGIATFGTSKSNISLGAGMGSEGGKVANAPVFTLSFNLFVSSQRHLISETYFFPLSNQTLRVFMLGGRFVEKDLSFDFGLVAFDSHSRYNMTLPWIGVMVPIGK